MGAAALVGVSAMPLELTELELETAARACRRWRIARRFRRRWRRALTA
jgi:hypothetical protein